MTTFGYNKYLKHDDFDYDMNKGLENNPNDIKEDIFKDPEDKKDNEYSTKVMSIADGVRYVTTRDEIFGDVKEFTMSKNPHDFTWNLEVTTR